VRLEIDRSEVARLFDLLGGDLVATAGRSRIQIHLPNLRCREVDLSFAVDHLHVRATVENVGLARARACDVVAQVWLSATGQTHLLQARCPALDAGSYQQLDLGVVHNVAGGQFANATVIVDPPTPAHPGGEVWESNKDDNVCTNGIYTALITPRDPPTADPGPPKGPPEPPIRPPQ
jgi:CARDB protein